MMISDRGTLILSPSDVSASTACEFGWLRQADAKLGRVPRVRRSDAMQERLAKLGATHEKRVTDALRENAGTYETIGRPAYPVTEAKIAAAASNTRRHAHGGVDVISQAVLFDGQTYGIADFLIKQSDGSYSVWDAKLARSAKTSARLQLATYADLLDQAGIARHRTAGLFLGSGKSLEIELDDLLPEVRARLTAARQLMTKHVAQSEVVAWESGGLSICGKCEHCAVEIEANDDVLLVHNLRRRDREHLRASGITTVQELASSNSTVEGLKEERWRTLRAQAAIQTRQVVHPDGSVTVAYEVFDPTPILNLPSPEAGDIFFDFEGDTMFEGDDSDLGIEYLWGLLELDGTSTGSFTPLWADDRATERDALVTFFDHLSHRRIDHPDMHVYHYASYEISALRRLCQRHAVGAAELEGLVADGVFVDLNPVVTKSVRISQRSYSIKMLEPLYMSDEERDADGVTSAVASITGYADYCTARDSGDSTKALALQGQLIAYNRYDCLSTWRLRDWLLSVVSVNARAATLSDNP